MNENERKNNAIETLKILTITIAMRLRIPRFRETSIECAIIEGIEALQKQIPKKPTMKIQKEDVRVGSIVFKAGTKTYICTCGNAIAYRDAYCRYCGQRLKWQDK